MKVGLALIPELAKAYESTCVRHATIGIASSAVLASTLHPASTFLRVAHTEHLGKQLHNKVYIAKPEPIHAIFKLRSMATIVGRNFMANTVVWMNKLQSDLAKLAEREEEEDEQLDIEVPPFKPVLKKSVVGVGRDFSIQILRRIYEILACSVVEPKLGCKLLKNVHSSAIRKRLRYFFAGVPLKQRLQIAGINVQKMTLTCFRSSCLGYLAEMTVRELIILYRTWIWETINFEEDREYDGVSHLDYFQYHTFWNLVKISTRLSLTSLGVGLSSLMSTQPEYWPAAGKLPTMTGFMLGDLAGATLVTYLELKFRPQTYWDIIEPDED